MSEEQIVARGMTKKQYAKWWYWENREAELKRRRDWTKVGLFKENITNLENAIAYLEYFQKDG